jgi:hypothetical protein
MTATSRTFRLYYNKTDGTPKFYTMEDLPGDYITVDHAVYDAGRYDIKVIDGKICSMNSGKIPKLKPVTEYSDTAVKCHVDDVSIIVDHAQPGIFWEYKIHN